MKYRQIDKFKLIPILVWCLCGQLYSSEPGFDVLVTYTSTMKVSLTNYGTLDYLNYYPLVWTADSTEIEFNHGLWVTGFRNDILIGITSSWVYDMSPGPILDGQAAMIIQPEDSASWRVFQINSTSGPGDPDYDEWPVGLGAPHYSDGTPKLYGEQTTYMVYNDANPTLEYSGYPESDTPTPIEIHETVWDYGETTGLTNVIFYRYQLYNRGPDDIYDVSVGYWSDMDLYEPWRNPGGYNSAGDYSYIYYSGSHGGYFPRAAACMQIQGPLVEAPGESGFAFGQAVQNAANLATTASYYIRDDYGNTAGNVVGFFPINMEQGRNVSLGLLPNGDPIINPITGDTSTFTYDGNPVTGEGWLSDPWNDGGAGFVTTSLGFELPAGDSAEVIYALIVVPSDSTNLALTDLENQAVWLRTWWEDNRLEISSGDVEPLPAEFRLVSAFPNPFNGTVRIRYSLAADIDVDISVYDLSGRLVESLSRGVERAGYHEISWEPDTQASGVYFIRLEGATRYQTMKVLYLK